MVFILDIIIHIRQNYKYYTGIISAFFYDFSAFTTADRENYL
jgi:hypothetical protein